jgi:hypothetical protein
MSTSHLPSIIRRNSLEKYGMSKYRLYELANSGELEQIAPGHFIHPGVLDDTTAGLASIALRNPKATLCLLSALALHDLTDEIPRQPNVALPRGDRTLETRFLSICWHQFDRETFELGREPYLLLDDIHIGLYSPERTIIDAFRLRHLLGPDVAVGALKRWLQQRKSSPAELLGLARFFPTALPYLRSTLEILL